jgi:hypothetical protein
MNLGKIEIGPIPWRKLDGGWPNGFWTILEPREVGQLVKNPKKNEVGPNPGRKLDNE